MNHYEDVHIVGALRTPIGNFNGAFANVSASELGAGVLKQLLNQCEIIPKDVDEVILGQVLTAGQCQNPARQASVRAGLPFEVPAWNLNMVCGSGLKAIVLGAQSIKCNGYNIVLAGGQENMSMAPHTLQMRAGIKMGDATLKDSVVFDGLTDAFNGYHMGMTAENIAQKWNISKEEQDNFALNSQQKCQIAIENGFFNNEIVPVTTTIRRENKIINEDEFPRKGCTIESLRKLKPCFIKNEDGTVTAGTSSGINDGAAAVLLMSGREIEKRGIAPIAKIVGWGQAGVDPAIMGTGPTPAIRKALHLVGWTINDVDLFELNEAFSAQSIAVIKELGLDINKVNIHGGAIALGHPIGASGARILVTLLHALQRVGGKRGVAALCIGGGMGIAICIEMTAI